MLNTANFKKIGLGSFSLTFLWSIRKSLFVIKFPKDQSDSSYKDWFKHVSVERLFLKNYAPRQRDVLLPKYVDFKTGYFIQEYIHGEPLTYDVYDNLPSKQQIILAKRLANFFLKLHQKTKSNYIPNKTRQKNTWLNLLDSEELKIYRKSNRFLQKNHPIMSWSCICVGDMKAEHLLYDSQKKTLGMIDFGSAHYGFPEDEFKINYPIRSHLSLKMIKNIITFYNETKHSISLKYIKNYLIVSSFQEAYENYINIRITEDEKQRLKKILSEFRTNLEQNFNEELD